MSRRQTSPLQLESRSDACCGGNKVEHVLNGGSGATTRRRSNDWSERQCHSREAVEASLRAHCRGGRVVVGYGRVPDTFSFASEVVAAGNAAIGAYSRCLSWVALNNTDGFVPKGIASMIGSRKELDALETVGMIEAVAAGEVTEATGRVSKKPDLSVSMPEDGYWLRDYLTYNIAAVEVAEIAAKNRRAGRESARRRSSDSDSQQRVQQRAEHEVDQQVNKALDRHVRSCQVKSPKIKPSVTAESESSPTAQGDETAPAGTSVSVGENDARKAGAVDQGEKVAGVRGEDAVSDLALSSEAVIAAARQELRDGISIEIAALIGCSAVMGKRLDPEAFDDSAILLRAERLVADGMRLDEAVAEARENFVAWTLPQERT